MLRLPQSDWQCGLEILEMKERLIAKALSAFAPLRASRWRARCNLLCKLSNSNVQISLPPLGCGGYLNVRDWHCMQEILRVGGGREIRTLEGLSSSPDFKIGAINRSAIPPQRAKPACYYNLFISQLTFLPTGIRAVSWQEAENR